jgi:hypothetical protein
VTLGAIDAGGASALDPAGLELPRLPTRFGFDDGCDGAGSLEETGAGTLICDGDTAGAGLGKVSADIDTATLDGAEGTDIGMMGRAGEDGRGSELGTTTGSGGSEGAGASDDDDDREAGPESLLNITAPFCLRTGTRYLLCMLRC